jgi:hypothetical protein
MAAFCGREEGGRKGKEGKRRQKKGKERREGGGGGMKGVKGIYVEKNSIEHPVSWEERSVRAQAVLNGCVCGCACL